MSKIKIQGNASGTGVVTLTAPNTNTDRTITLPDSTSTLLETNGNGSSLTSLTGSQVDSGQTTAKAWVNFNGTGTVAIRDSYNVSSITDNGTGDYTVNFTNDMANTDYSMIAQACRATGDTVNQVYRDANEHPTSRTTGLTRVVSGYSYSASDALEDMSHISVQVFGD